jgi:hypothetical protein
MGLGAAGLPGMVDLSAMGAFFPPPPPGVGRVYVRYAALEQVARARAALHGRKFGGNAVVAAYFDEARFEAGEL